MAKRAISLDAPNLLNDSALLGADVTPPRHSDEAIESPLSLFQAVWDSSGDGMRLTDAEGCTVAVNKAFCKLAGLTSPELLGRPFTVIYSQGDDAARILKKYLQRFQKRNLQKTVERTLALHDGRIVDLAVTNSFVELNGKEPLMLSIFRDVTRNKTAERLLHKSEAKMRLIWENALDGMRLMDECGKIVMVNASYCRLVGRLRAELEGQLLSVVYDSSRAAHILRNHRERFQTRTIPPHQLKEFTLWNGKKVFLELSNSFLEIADQPPLLLTTFRDITEGVRAQSRLRMIEQEFAIEKERERIARDSELQEAIGMVFNGGTPTSGRIARKVGQYLHQLPQFNRNMDALSKREEEVLHCLARGCLYKDIASQLSISIDTVRKHLQSIYNKLQVHSRTDAVVKYLQTSERRNQPPSIA